MHVTDELVAGRDSGAVGSSSQSDRKQQSCDEGAVGERSKAKKQS